MSTVRIKLRKFQIFLLGLDLKLLKSGKNNFTVHRSYSWNDIFSPGWAEERAGRKRERKDKENKKKTKQIKQLIKNLKRRGYLEEKHEADKRLFYLTAKGQFEILYSRFLEQIQNESQKKWDNKWRLIIFDIPETHRKSRNVLRRILKAGFVSVQKSVWITPFDVVPTLKEILQYLSLSRYIECFEVTKFIGEGRFLADFKISHN